MSVQKLVIDGYRAIDHFEYEPNMINVLVGRNGTGKSSILEAIAIGYTAPSFLSRLRINVLEMVISEKGWELEHLFHMAKKQKEFKIVIRKNDGVEVNVYALYEKCETVPTAIEDLMIQHYADKRSDEASVFFVEGKLLEINKLSAEEVAEFFTKVLQKPIVYGQTILHDQKSPKPNYFSFAALSAEKKVLTRGSVTTDLIFYSRWLEEKFDAKSLHLYEFLQFSKKVNRALGLLKHYAPYLNDLRRDDRTLWVHFEGQQPLPLSAMGDGFREVVRLILASSFVPDGVLIIDSMGSLHPALTDIVAEWLVEEARQEKTQVFISTQNLELIEKLLRTGGELVNLVRIYRVKDELAYEVLSCSEALEELDELRIDLRGP